MISVQLSTLLPVIVSVRMWLLRFVEKCHISDHDGSGQDHGESFVFIPKFQGTFPKNNCKILVIECEKQEPQ